VGYSWHSYHPNPSRRHSDRRSGSATDALHDALGGARQVQPGSLTPAQLRRQRERRASRQHRHARRRGRLAEALIVVGLAALVIVIALSVLALR